MRSSGGGTGRARWLALFIVRRAVRVSVFLAAGMFLYAMGCGPAFGHASEFCSSPLVAHNYWRPLEEIPKPHLLPRTGKLGFGPGSLRIYPPRSELVLVGREVIYLSGSSTAVGSGPATREVNKSFLGWTVSSRLEQIDRGGGITKILKRKAQYIDRVGGFGRRRNFGFSGSLKAGIYRLVLNFEGSKHRSLGKYEVLFRVVEARSRLRLGISSPKFSSGAVGFLRVENLGTVRTQYYYRYRLWSLSGETRVPVALEPMILTNDKPSAPPGMAADCFTFKLPNDLPAGDYVIGIPVNNFLTTRQRFLLKQFSVTG